MTHTTLPSRRHGAAALAALAVVAAAAALAGCGRGSSPPEATAGAAAMAAAVPAFEAPEPGSYELPPIQPAADGAVLDARGRRRRLFDYLGGDYVLMAFIYTRCAVAEACPFATRTFQRVRRQAAADPEVAGALRLVTVSFDPAADTPAVMADYAADAGAGESADGGSGEDWSFLTTASPADLQPILDAYGQYLVREVGSDGRYTGGISHVLKIYLIDPQRRVRNIYSSEFLHPSLVLADVKTLMLEAGSP